MKFHLMMNQGKYMINITDEILEAFKPIAHEKTDPFFQEFIDTQWIYKLFNNEFYIETEPLRVPKPPEASCIMPLLSSSPLIKSEKEIFIPPTTIESHVYVDDVFLKHNTRKQYLNDRVFIKIKDSLLRQMYARINVSISSYSNITEACVGIEELNKLCKQKEGYIVMHPADYFKFKFPNGQTAGDFMHYKRSDVREDFIMNEDDLDVMRTGIYGTYHKTKIIVSPALVEKHQPLFFEHDAGKMYSFDLGKIFLAHEIVDRKLKFVVIALMNTGIYLDLNKIRKIWLNP